MTAPVLVGVDGSESALDAVRWAAGEAARRRTSLRLVHAVDSTVFGHDPRTVMQYRDQVQARAHERILAAETAAVLVAPGLDVIHDLVPGTPIVALVAGSAHAQLAVVGHRGLGGFAGLLAGSVAIALAAHAACPVVVVRATPPDGPPSDGPVVVGVDGSPLSEDAVAFAYEAAAARGVPLVVVHAWQDHIFEAELAPLVDWDAIESAEHRVLAERLAGWAQKFPDVAVQPLVRRGGAAHALVEQSTGAQLVVVGSRGRGGLVGLVLGSVSHALLHHARCPVAVVRPDPVLDQPNEEQT